MATLGELARLIRSQNAGPFELTFDIMFAKPEVYEHVRDSGALTREVVAAQYGLSPDEVKFFLCDNALAFKASIPRPNFQGDLRDSDNHGGQQYAPLAVRALNGYRDPGLVERGFVRYSSFV